MRLNLVAAVVGYLLGSIPTGFWLGKAWKKIDVRKHGSGNLGATNVFRVLGWKAGVITLLVDVLKGYLAVRLFRGAEAFAISNIDCVTYVGNPNPCGGSRLARIVGPSAWTAGIASIVGHSTSPFVGFRGGKGVATAAGVFIGVLPAQAGIAVAAFALVFALSRIVSLSSIVAAVALSASTILMTHDPFKSGVTSAVALFVIWRHRSNISRLLAGTEKPLRSGGGTPA